MQEEEMERLEDGISPSAAPSPTPKDNNNIPGISPVTYAKAAAPRPRVYITRPIHLPDSLADVPMSGPAMAGTVSKQLSVKVFCDVVPVFKAKGAIGKALLVHYPKGLLSFNVCLCTGWSVDLSINLVLLLTISYSLLF